MRAEVTVIGPGLMGTGTGGLLTREAHRISAHIKNDLHLNQIIARPLQRAQSVEEQIRARADYFRSSESWPPDDAKVEVDGDTMIVNGQRIRFVLADVKGSEKIVGWDPNNLIAIDATSDAMETVEEYERFRARIDAHKDLKFLVTHNVKDAPIRIVGVNADEFNPGEEGVVANSSCTTKCAAVVLEPLLREIGNPLFAQFFGLHGTTPSQHLHGEAHTGDARKARAAHNIIPTSTGASEGIGKVYPDLRIGPILVARVPTPDVSLLYTILIYSGKRDLTEEKVNDILIQRAAEYPHVLRCESRQNLVSSDAQFMTQAAVVDTNLTKIYKLPLGLQAVVTGAYYAHARASQAQVLYLADHVVSKI